MTRRGRVLGCAVGAALLTAIVPDLAGAADPVPAIRMKLATATMSGDRNEWMRRFQRAVETRGAGQIKLDLFPGGQLGSRARSLSGLQTGRVEGWIGSSAGLGFIDRRFEVTEMPGIYDDIAHAQRTVSDPEFRAVYLALGRAKGLTGVSLYASRTVALVTRERPLQRIDDFRNLRIGVLSAGIEEQVLRGLGAVPVPMPLPQMRPALFRGGIDGVRAAMETFIPFKYWDTARYMTETGSSAVIAGAFVSQKWLSRLPRKLRRIVMEEAAKLDAPIHQYAVAYTRQLRQIWTDNHGRIHSLSPVARRQLRQRLAAVGQRVMANRTDVLPVYNLLLRVAERHRVPEGAVPAN